MPRPDKGEIIEGLAEAIWPIDGGTRTWKEAKDAALTGDPEPMAALDTCYMFADRTYVTIRKMLGRVG